MRCCTSNGVSLWNYMLYVNVKKCCLIHILFFIIFKNINKIFFPPMAFFPTIVRCQSHLFIPTTRNEFLIILILPFLFFLGLFCCFFMDDKYVCTGIWGIKGWRKKIYTNIHNINVWQTYSKVYIFNIDLTFFFPSSLT